MQYSAAALMPLPAAVPRVGFLCIRGVVHLCTKAGFALLRCAGYFVRKLWQKTLKGIGMLRFHQIRDFTTFKALSLIVLILLAHAVQTGVLASVLG